MHCRHDCGLWPMCLHLYSHRAISLTGSTTDHRKDVDRPLQKWYGDCAVIVLFPQPCIEIARIKHGALAASIRRPCGDRTVAV